MTKRKRTITDTFSVDRAPATTRKVGPLKRLPTLALLLLISQLLSTASAWFGSTEQPIEGHPSQGEASIFDSSGPVATADPQQKKISAMNVLLPISLCKECRKVKHELKALNGCYTWHNSHPQMVSMTDRYGRELDRTSQDQNTCHDSVFLMAKTAKETKSIILITARDLNSGTVLKCNAKVAQVDRLDIFMRSKQLSVASNHHLTVVGYDDEDNIFSSMDGFRYDWTITSGTDIIKKFSAPDIDSRLAHQSDVFFVRSMKAGFAEVSVKLEEPGYERVKTVLKKLTVVDPFIILPSEPVYILPTSRFALSLAHLNMESVASETRPIQIPNPQYRWSSPDAEIGAIGDDGVFTSRVTEGLADILVVDQHMKNNTADGSINVVYPYRLEVAIKDVTETDVLQRLHAGDSLRLGDTYDSPQQEPHILIQEHLYSIHIRLFDKDDHRITLTENLRFNSANLDEAHIEVVKRNAIGSELLIRTKPIPADKDQVFVASLHTLEEIIAVNPVEKFSQLASHLSQEKDLVITRPIKIQHPTNSVLLPFLPMAHEAHGAGEVWSLSARGGSGVYTWAMKDTNVATVHGSALVKSVSIGKTQLVVRDHRNHDNWDAIEVEVTQISQLTWLEEQSELRARLSAEQPGEERTLSLIALDSKGRKFTNCTAVRPSFAVKGEGIVKLADATDGASYNKYAQIKDYLRLGDSKELVRLRQRLDEQAAVQLVQDLSGNDPKLSETLTLHNHFGICAQRKVHGEVEGLARIMASFTVYDYLNGPARVLDSEFAEVAVYTPLTSVAPSYRPYLRDLLSVTQAGQEFVSFNQFFTEWKLVSQFGSSVVWQLRGGTNFWKDQQENYSITWTTADIGNERGDVVEVSKLREATTAFDLKIKCQTPPSDKLDKSHRTLVHLSQSSKATRRLLRPARHDTSVEVHCEPPSALKLTWTQSVLPTGSSTLGQLPRSAVIASERTHYVLVNSEHAVRYLALDHESMVSFNSSSLLTTVESSDRAIARISAYKDSGKSYADDCLSGLYDRRSVAFSNQTGTVYLTASSGHYLEDVLSAGAKVEKSGGSGYSLFGGSSSKTAKSGAANDLKDDVYKESLGKAAVRALPGSTVVKDRMRIEVVRNVDVEPKSKTLYIGQGQQSFRLNILHGSGHFSVTLNDTRLVNVTHKDREIYVTPKALGGLLLTVEDVELPNSELAVAELLISDIGKLTLTAPRTLMEKGDQMELLVSAFDLYGREFDADQYALMTFGIETEITGISKSQGLQTDAVPEDNRKFIVTGHDAGVYHSSAYTLRFPFLGQQDGRPVLRDTAGKKHTIVSEMLRIEVFPILEILPGSLLITPNMRYTVQIEGGPQSRSASSSDGSHVEIKFEIADPEIATIDQFREVTGHKTGDTVLKYEIVQLRSQQSDASQKQLSRVVSKKTIPIRVRLVSEIEIPLADRREIFSESLIKLNAVLKFGTEYFNHGVAPISYTWNCTQSRSLDLQIPSKQKLAHAHGVVPADVVMTSKYVRDNLRNANRAEFFTSFNSSSVYAKADQEGDATVSVLLAIEYPSKYHRDQNWFKTSATIKVSARLAISLPEYSEHTLGKTHMYLVPPNTQIKIETNRQTRLKLGYSQQSVFDYATQSYRYTDATSPIIELVNDESIRTFDKHGKVTVLVEEGGAFSDQIVMLNVKIADVFTLASMRAYDALSLPLGSSIELPLHLQDIHAHLFADKIEGISVGVLVSHPRVLSVALDRYNQTLTVQSQGSGDCNVVVYLEEHPHIFDVIRVRVSSVVQPLSPVYLHLGGQVNFMVQSTDGAQGQDSGAGKSEVWSSSSPSVLEIEPTSGKATGLREGKANVLLSDHVNAASIVHVSKVASAELDQQSQLIINTDQAQSGWVSSSSQREYRVRVKLFLDKQSGEVLPTLSSNGVTLVHQNIGLGCISDSPNFVAARGEVNDFTGFYCVMTYVGGADVRGMPRVVKITATAFAYNQSGRELYANQVAEFEMQLASEIVVESKFRQQVTMCNEHRNEEVKVFSSSGFAVQISYENPADRDLVLYRVEGAPDSTSNEYTLALAVPNQVSHAFKAKLSLEHPNAPHPALLQLDFTAERPCMQPTDSYFSYGSTAQPARAEVKPAEPQVASSPSPSSSSDSSPGWGAILVFFFVIVISIVFSLMMFCNMDVSEIYYRLTQRSERSRVRDEAYYGGYSRGFRDVPRTQGVHGDGVRNARALKSKPLSRDQTFSTIYGRNSTMSSRRDPGFQNADPRLQQVRHRVNLDDDSLRQRDASARQSSYSRIHNSDRFY